jgi:hypothetical protein
MHFGVEHAWGISFYYKINAFFIFSFLCTTTVGIPVYIRFGVEHAWITSFYHKINVL